MRKIKYIFVHCSASPQTWTVENLKQEFKAKGWKKPGYHYSITSDGAVHQMLEIEAVSNGVQGYNSNSINVCYVGGIDKAGKPIDNRTEAQKKSLVTLLRQLKKTFPTAKIMGHRSIWGENTPSKWKKYCPCFNAEEEYNEL